MHIQLLSDIYTVNFHKWMEVKQFSIDFIVDAPCPVCTLSHYLVPGSGGLGVQDLMVVGSRG